jgi:sugar O-acyltransferase (sialic acid O-acetyltransferase NeuD family)
VLHDDYYDNNIPAVVAVGDPNLRKKICQTVRIFKKVIDPSVIITDPHSVWIKEGVIICPGSILTTDIIIGRNCHINLACTIGHDTILKDYVTVSPGVNISGHVNIGEKCYIGTNTSIKEGINICSEVTVGMGAVVTKNINEPGIYVGIPARRIK